MPENPNRVLVVDDEPEIRRFLRATLKAYQYTVFEADNGVQALAAFGEFRPDLVILDLGLPDLDGVEITRRIRALGETPVIVLSVRDREADKIEALDAGADDYLTKPFGVGELLARMRVVLRRSAAGLPERPGVGSHPSPGNPGRQGNYADPHRIRPAARADSERGQGVDPPPADPPGLGDGL